MFPQPKNKLQWKSDAKIETQIKKEQPYSRERFYPSILFSRFILLLVFVFCLSPHTSNIGSFFVLKDDEGQTKIFIFISTQKSRKKNKTSTATAKNEMSTCISRFNASTAPFSEMLILAACCYFYYYYSLISIFIQKLNL